MMVGVMAPSMSHMMVYGLYDGCMWVCKFVKKTKNTNHQGVMVRKTITGDGFLMVF